MSECEHEWEFKDPENIGWEMAFCKKCGHLRGSKPKCSLQEALEKIRILTGCGKKIDGIYKDRKCKGCQYNPVK